GDDRPELFGCRAVHDHSVAAERELVAYRSDAVSRAAARHRGKPLFGDQRRHVLELLVGADDVEPTNSRHDRVSENLMEDLQIPTVRTHEELAVALQVRREATDRLHEPLVLGDVVAHGGEARPDLDRRRVTTGALRGALDGLHTTHGRLV